MSSIAFIMTRAPVIPVIVIEDIAHAVPLAEALVAGGLPVLEVTLRTPVALEAIRAIRGVDGAIVGAGTVTNAQQLDQALAAGSEFIVSPGLTEALGKAAIAAGVPFLPGVATAGDIMRGLDSGAYPLQILPGDGGGRTASIEGARRAVRPVPILPDRRDHARQRRAMARARSGAVRRRELGRAAWRT